MRRLITMSFISAVIVLGAHTAYQPLTPKAAAAEPVGLTGRLIPIVTGATVFQDQPQALGGFVSVSDCGQLDLFISATVSNDTRPPGSPTEWLNTRLDLSPDGATAFSQVGTIPSGDILIGSGVPDGTVETGASRFAWNVAAFNLGSPNGGGLNGAPASPYVRLNMSPVGADATNISAQLYCTTAAAASVGGIAEQPNLPAAVGHGMSYTLPLLLIAAACIVGAGWWVRRKRAD